MMVGMEGGGPNISEEALVSLGLNSSHSVPDIIRKKIQIMLLLKHSAIGCTLSLIEDEYKTYFNEIITPAMFGFKTWFDMLKSMPDEVVIHKLKGQRVVNGQPLGQNWTIFCLKNIFSRNEINGVHRYPPNNPDANFPAIQPSQPCSVPNGDSHLVVTDPLLVDFLGEDIVRPAVNHYNSQGSHPVHVTNGDMDTAGSQSVLLPPPAENQPVSENTVTSGQSTSQASSNNGKKCPVDVGSSPQASVNNVHESSSNTCNEPNSVQPSLSPVETKSAILYSITHSSAERATTALADPQIIKRSSIKTKVENNGACDIRSHPIVVEPLVGDMEIQIIGESRNGRPKVLETPIKRVSPMNTPTVCENNLASSSKPKNKLFNHYCNQNVGSVVEELLNVMKIAAEVKKSPVKVVESSGNSSEISLNELVLTTEPVASTSEVATTLANVSMEEPILVTNEESRSEEEAGTSTTEPTTSANCLSEATKKLVASLPKCEVKLQRLVFRDTPSSSPESASNTRKRKYSDCSEHSICSVEASSESLRSSARLQEKEKNGGKPIYSPSPVRSPAKKPAKDGRKSVIVPAEEIDDEIDPVQEVPFPKWYISCKNGSEMVPVDNVYENFMHYTNIVSSVLTSTFIDDVYYPCGAYFPPNCELNLDEVAGNIDLGKVCLQHHVFGSLLLENQPRDCWEIRVRDDLIFPLMNFESYQVANLDYTFDFEISKHGAAGAPLSVISSYGNFADYFLWKRGQNCKCLGVMPDAGNGFAKLHTSPGISYENFTNFSNDLCDIFDPVITRDLEDRVISMFPNRVDVMVASALSFSGMSNRSEDLAILQALLALKFVREGGIFILKTLDTTSDFTVGLIFYLSRCFQKIALEKPESALPGERFIICFWKCNDECVLKIAEYFKSYNEKRIEHVWEGIPFDFNSIFGVGDLSTCDLISSMDAEFIYFIRMHNADISRKEIKLTEGITERNFESTLDEIDAINDQHTIALRNSCLQKWGVHRKDNIIEPLSLAPLPQYVLDIVNQPAVTSVRDTVIAGNWINAGETEQWAFVLSANINSRSIVIVTSNGDRSCACQFKNGLWQDIPDLFLPSGTILYAEIIPASKSRKPLLFVIDANALGKESLHTFNYTVRLDKCVTFLQSAEVISSNLVYCFTCAKEFPLRQLPTIMMELVVSKRKFTSKYFKTPVCQAAATKSTSTDLNFEVKEIIFLQTKCKFDGALAFSGWRDCDFGRSILNQVTWELRASPISHTMLQKLKDLTLAEDCFPIFEYLNNLSLK